ncbi:MAG TPA: helix-turn-helix domain-containing protein [Candidatus Nanoarchaeia archaeon]|nr:helix-turn-helix domain-containing protein [Candidatus Nanoarchaeia archaeon]
MVQTHENILVDLGLSKNETKSYIALLELGIAATGQVAEKSKLHRASAYDALERLQAKGLVSFHLRQSIKYYEAMDPKNLLHLLKTKEQQLEEIMPQLQLLRELALSQSQATISEGVQSFTDILYSFLEYKEPILAYGIPPIAPEIMKARLSHFHGKRIPLKIPMKHIYNHNAQERIAYLNTLAFTEARYLPAKFDSQVSTTVCGDEVVLSVWISPPILIRIKDKRIADSYKKYFDLLWNAAEK